MCTTLKTPQIVTTLINMSQILDLHQTVTSYKIELLDGYLISIPVPQEAIVCSDFHCTGHSSEVQKFHDSIINCCLAAADCTTPVFPEHKSRASIRKIAFT